MTREDYKQDVQKIYEYYESIDIEDVSGVIDEIFDEFQIMGICDIITL